MMKVTKPCYNVPIPHFQALNESPTKPKELVTCKLSSSNTNPFLTKTQKIVSLPLSASSLFSTLASIPSFLYASFSKILDPPLQPLVDPRHVYTGNLAPVDEMEPTDCPVIEGKLPLSLKGVYIRNGPNPQIQSPRALLLFDGDGMLHSLRFSNGHATYCCRYLLSNMTAHPKVDLDTKETFAFSWSLSFPHLKFFHFDGNGVKQNEVPIFSINQPCFIHDFAITKRFAIFHETQLVYSLGKVMTGRGTLVDYEPNKTPRIGIIPKYAINDSEMRWVRVPGFNTIHIINAWENGDDEIVFMASNIICVTNIFNKTVDVSLEKVKINIKTGDVSRKIISPRNLEFGSINPSYVGRKTHCPPITDDRRLATLLPSLTLQSRRKTPKTFFFNQWLEIQDSLPKSGST
ncbi:Carotenoid oxygenase - like 10 [Theobroma cacao]|nr:Carotenoid oxygenase - like 10 [Theobroma cacao]